MSIKRKYILPEKTRIARTANEFVHPVPTWFRFQTTRTAYYDDDDIDEEMSRENESYKNDPVIVFAVPDVEWPRIKVNLSQLLLYYPELKHPLRWNGKTWQYEYSIIIGD